jgi:hypothetical protein
MKVSRKMNARNQAKEKKMSDNPLTNVYIRLKKKRSSSRVTPIKKTTYRKNTLITKSYTKLGIKRSTSREKTILEVELQKIDDRFGDEPM